VAADFIRRAELVKQRCVVAADNLQAAQHRDTLRYAKLRSGFYTPKMHSYLPGDYVYVKQHDKAGLDLPAKKLILRVAEVRPSGVLVLQGRCGKLQHVNMNNCAPCHLPNVDPAIDWSLRKGPEDAVCEHCGDDDVAVKGSLIFCDNCNGAWHLSCHNPTLNKRPRGTWVCCQCLQQGITVEMIKSSQKEQDQLARQQMQPERYTAGQQQDKALHGRLLYRTFVRDLQGNPVTKRYLGLVHFRGVQPDGNLLVIYEDGDAEVTTRQSLKAAAVEWLPEGTAVPANIKFATPSEAYNQIQQTAQQRAAETATMRAARPTAANTGPKSKSQQQRGRRTTPGSAYNKKPATESRPVMRTRSMARQSAAANVAAATTSMPMVAPRAAASPLAADTIKAGTTALNSTDELCLLEIPTNSGSPLPEYWDLTSAGGVQEAMQLLMPGRLPSKDATRIARMIAGALNPESTPAAKGFVPTETAELEVLLQSVDFSGCSTFYDPYAGSGTVARVLAMAGFNVTQNDVDQSWGHATATDALQPGNYMLSPQVIVTSPPFELLDLAAPLAARMAGVVACIHVPGHWISNPRVARQQWLQELAVQGRVHVVMGLPRGAIQRRCAWLLVFASSCKKQLMLQTGSYSVPCYYAQR